MELEVEKTSLLVPNINLVKKRIKEILKEEPLLFQPIVPLLETYENRIKDINQIALQDLKGGVKITIKIMIFQMKLWRTSTNI